MKIRDIEIKNGLFLAPMAGYSDFAMRQICKEWGAEYLTTEMVSAKAITFHDKKTLILAHIQKEELPCSLQLFGHEPEVLGEAAKQIYNQLEVKPSAIDINMGCPVHKIVSNGDGSSILKTPLLAKQLVESVKSNVPIPVTAKIRIGFDENSINAIEVAKSIEDGGADAIFVHGRTRTQFYSGQVHYDVIKEIKKTVSIPVIGNGDVTNIESAKRLLDTGCDGIMIGRGAVGNPFLFDEITHYLEGKPYTSPSISERIDIALKQLTLSIQDKGEHVAVQEARKYLSSYIHGLRDASKTRQVLSYASTYEQVQNILEEFKQKEEG